MILSDSSIEYYCKEFNLIKPYNEEQLNSASYDIRVGQTYIKMDKKSSSKNKNEIKYFKDLKNKDNELYVYPREFFLVASFEFFSIPNYLCGEFYLKSSAARAGFEHSHACFCDPGWKGILTMEIKNHTEHTLLKLYPGLRIGQMKFTKLDRVAKNPYYIKGNYYNDSRVYGDKTNKYRIEEELN